MSQEFKNTYYIEETQSDKLKFENKYRGMAYLLKKLLKEEDITSSEYNKALAEMERMKIQEKKKKFPQSA